MSQPLGTGRICLHSSLSPPHWVVPNRVGSASTEGKSVSVAATWNTQTGSQRLRRVKRGWVSRYNILGPVPAGIVHPEKPTLYLIPILSIAVQAGLIVHVIKTGRNMLWIWAIALLPLVGSIAYVVVEVLPQALGGRTARRAKSSVRRMLDPDRELRRAHAEVEISGNVDARRRLAEELFERGQNDAAIDVYQGGLKGIFEHDPTLLLGMARAQFAKQDYAAARVTLERLAHQNPDFKSADADLLYARTLEAQEALDEAERVYTSLAPVYPGAEARLRYALLLKRRGNLAAANRVLKDLLDGARLGPAHYRRAQAEWLERARRELS